MHGIILCSLILFVVICYSNGAPVETQIAAKKGTRVVGASAVGASVSKRLQIAPYTNSSASTKSSIDTHPKPKRRRHRHKRRHKLHRHRHKLYPLKDRMKNFVGGSTAYMRSQNTKSPHPDFEMTNGEIYEHGGVPDLSATLLNQIWPKEGMFSKTGKIVIGGKRSHNLKYGRTEEEVHDIIGFIRTNGHSRGRDTNIESRDSTSYHDQDYTKNSTALHHLFQDNDSGSTDEDADDIDDEDVVNNTNNVGQNKELIINILPSEDYTSDDITLQKSEGITPFNNTKLINSSATDPINYRHISNVSNTNNSASSMKLQENVIGDEDDTLIENTEVLQIPTHPKEFGNEQNKIVLDKSPGLTSNVTDMTLERNSTNNGTASAAANEGVANNSTNSGSVASFVDEIISNYSSRTGEVSLRENTLDEPKNATSNTSLSDPFSANSKRIGPGENSNTFVNTSTYGNDTTTLDQRLIEKQKVYNDLHKFIEKLVSFDKLHRSLEDLNGTQMVNATKSDQLRAISNDRNVTFDKLHSFVENLVFLDKSIYLVEHIGDNSTLKALGLNDTSQIARGILAGSDIKHRIPVDKVRNISEVKNSAASTAKNDAMPKTTQKSNKKDGKRFMDIVFSDNSTQSMNSSSGINADTLNKLHANMDNLVSNCLGFDSGDKKPSHKSYDTNGDEMEISVRTSTGDLMLSCRGLNGANRTNSSQKLSKSSHNRFGKDDNITMSKSSPNLLGKEEKTANVFLTKRNEKNELQSKRNQTTHEDESTNAVNGHGDTPIPANTNYSKNHSKNSPSKRTPFHKLLRNGTSKQPSVASKYIHHPRRMKKLNQNLITDNYFDYSNQTKPKLTKSLKDTLGFLSHFDTHFPKICDSADTRTLARCGKEISTDKQLKAGQLTTPGNYTIDNDVDIISNDNGNIERHQLRGMANKRVHHRIINLPEVTDSVSDEDIDKLTLENRVAEFGVNPNNINYDDYYNDNDNAAFNYKGISEGDQDGIKMVQDYNAKIPQVGDYQNDRGEYVNLMRDANTPDEDGEQRRLLAPPQANIGPMMVTQRITDMGHNQIHLYTGPAVHYYKPRSDRLNVAKPPDTEEDEKIIESMNRF